MNQEILIENALVDISHNQGGNSAQPSTQSAQASVVEVGTVLANMAHYGYVPSKEVLDTMTALTTKELVAFWQEFEPTVKKITGADKDMGSFVVYKNFPKEVLDMSKSEYWFNQTLIYWGLPAKYVASTEAPREKTKEKKALKVLGKASADSLLKIFEGLKKQSSRWNDKQQEWAIYLLGEVVPQSEVMNMRDFGFKENGVVLVAHILKEKQDNKKALAMPNAMATLPGLKASLAQTRGYTVDDATDVLRIAAALSEGDISLREKVIFKAFPRSLRKELLGLLENSKNLSADASLRKEAWKKFLKNLHPGDYNFKKVSAVYDELYNNVLETFNAKVEKELVAKDNKVLKTLSSRPGEFLRRLHSLYNTFGREALDAFQTVASTLTTSQLVKLDKYVETISTRKNLMYPPKGNWGKVQVLPNTKSFQEGDTDALRAEISRIVGARLDAMFPAGIDLDPMTENVKLQTNDQKLAAYGRGTVLDLPENMKFARTASYWKNDPKKGTTWFDNGWNFFDSKWQNKFTCCWNAQAENKSAVFSGDPVNSKDMEGRACQMIDLYFDKLLTQGVRYAVWNVLAFSHVKFSEAEDVMGTLQLGEHAEKGKLFEPARAQMVFPIKSETMSNYVAYLDLQKRKLVYMDAALPAQVSSAAQNAQKLQEVMPAFLEYVASLPTIYDVFKHAKSGTTPVVYSDVALSIVPDEAGQKPKAYVFKSENVKNAFEALDMSAVLEDASVPESLTAKNNQSVKQKM